MRQRLSQDGSGTLPRRKWVSIFAVPIMVLCIYALRTAPQAISDLRGRGDVVSLPVRTDKPGRPLFVCTVWLGDIDMATWSKLRTSVVLAFAVWEDGHVVWTEDVLQGRYRKAQISASQARECVARFTRKGALWPLILGQEDLTVHSYCVLSIRGRQKKYAVLRGRYIYALRHPPTYGRVGDHSAYEQRWLDTMDQLRSVIPWGQGVETAAPEPEPVFVPAYVPPLLTRKHIFWLVLFGSGVAILLWFFPRRVGPRSDQVEASGHSPAAAPPRE